MHKLILGAWARKSMSPLDRIASRRRPLQFAAAGSSFTGVDSPASAQSTSASSSPDAGATGISPEATSARSRAAWAPEAGLEVADSLLERDGFELPVPDERGYGLAFVCRVPWAFLFLARSCSALRAHTRCRGLPPCRPVPGPGRTGC
jgi:hypothetical protein